MYNPIGLVEKNIHGAWVVYGDIGVKQYYYYTKEKAMTLYREEVRKRNNTVSRKKL